jgi:preprotein translocase subunit Sss1
VANYRGLTVTENGRAYDDGYAAGGINARLANHDLHFKNINGSIDHLASELTLTRLELQKQADAAQAARDAVVAAAQVLEKSVTGKRDRFQRYGVLIGAVLMLIGIVTFILSFSH